MAPQELYTRLRREGEVIVPAEDVGVLSSVRRLAAQDGLSIAQYRERRAPGTSTYWARHRPYKVALVHPSDRTTIVYPDAGGRS